MPRASLEKKKGNVVISATELQRAKAFVIPKLSMPISLDAQFKDYLTDVQLCLIFLERFADSEPLISKLVQEYQSDSTKGTPEFSLDSLCKKANFEPSTLRRLLLATIDYLATDDANIKLSLSTPSLVEKSIQVAMDESHPDSYNERKELLEFKGFRKVGQNTKFISIQNGDTTVNNTTQLNIGLPPSFSSSMSDSERIANQSVKQLIEKSKVIDISPIEKVKESSNE